MVVRKLAPREPPEYQKEVLGTRLASMPSSPVQTTPRSSSPTQIDEFFECIPPEDLSAPPPHGAYPWSPPHRAFLSRCVHHPRDHKAAPPSSPMIELYELVFAILVGPLESLLQSISFCCTLPAEWSHAVIFWVRKSSAEPLVSVTPER